MEARRSSPVFILLTCMQEMECPYLYAMIEMDRLGLDVFAILIDPRQAVESLSEPMDYLEFRLKSLQQSLRLENSAYRDGIKAAPAQVSLDAFISTRANHLRLLAQFRSLSSASSAASRPSAVKAIISAAEENVLLYKTAKEHGSGATLLQGTFDHFLMAAVSSMLLAATYNPDKYAPLCRRPFNTGIEMLDSLPHKPRGTDPRRRYSMAHLRKLAQQVQITSQAEDDGNRADGLLTPGASASNVYDTTLSVDMNASQLGDDTFGGIMDFSNLDANMAPWDEKWFDLVLQASSLYPGPIDKDLI